MTVEVCRPTQKWVTVTGCEAVTISTASHAERAGLRSWREKSVFCNLGESAEDLKTIKNISSIIGSNNINMFSHFRGNKSPSFTSLEPRASLCDVINRHPAVDSNPLKTTFLFPSTVKQTKSFNVTFFKLKHSATPPVKKWSEFGTFSERKCTA